MALLPLDHAASRVSVEGEKRGLQDCTRFSHGPRLEAECIMMSTFKHIPLATVQSHGRRVTVWEVGEHVLPSAHKQGVKWRAGLPGCTAAPDRGYFLQSPRATASLPWPSGPMSLLGGQRLLS